MKTVCLVNMQASRAKGKKALIKREMADVLGVEDVYFIDDPSKMVSKLKNALKDKPDLVVVGGGDGTIISVLSELDKAGYTGEVGLLPVGTANYLVRNLEIPLDLKEAIKVCKEGVAKTVNLPTVNKEVFSLMATIGVTTNISKHTRVERKQKLGQFAYITEGFKQVYKHNYFKYALEIDGSDEPVTGISHQIIVSNADLNKQIAVTPTGRLEDSEMLLTVYNTQRSRIGFLLTVGMYILTVGRFKAGMKTWTIESVKITTDPPRSVAIDGEVAMKTPVEITNQGPVVKIRTMKEHTDGTE